MFFLLQVVRSLGSVEGEWGVMRPMLGLQYTSLSEIKGENFDKLEIAWAWASIDGELDLEGMLGSDADDINFGRLQATPLMVEVCYT